jgi:hypothetical protein
MECNNSKKWVGYGHFAECNTRQRLPLPSAMPKTLGKAEKTKPILTNFPALPSAGEAGTRQRIFQKKSFFFAECHVEGHSTNKFLKKNFFLCRV